MLCYPKFSWIGKWELTWKCSCWRRWIAKWRGHCVWREESSKRFGDFFGFVISYRNALLWNHRFLAPYTCKRLLHFQPFYSSISPQRGANLTEFSSMSRSCIFLIWFFFCPLALGFCYILEMSLSNNFHNSKFIIIINIKYKRISNYEFWIMKIFCVNFFISFKLLLYPMNSSFSQKVLIQFYGYYRIVRWEEFKQ